MTLSAKVTVANAARQKATITTLHFIGYQPISPPIGLVYHVFVVLEQISFQILHSMSFLPDMALIFIADVHNLN